MSSDVKFVQGVGFMVYEDYTSDDYEPIDEKDDEQDLSNYEWCSLAECYVDKVDCANRGCENCSYYLDS